MTRKSPQVALHRCFGYDRQTICDIIDKIVSRLEFPRSFNGRVVLLKPNLISGRSAPLACTDKEFIAAAASWFLDHGATVHIGDSPAFGSGVSVARQQGITEALAGMNVKQVDFSTTSKKTLRGGVMVDVAKAALECDYFINLPKVKAHNQMYVTLATKNVFGIVKGVNKAMIHMRHGNSHEQFAGIIIDLLDLLPQALHLVDGITAMHKSGPLDGEPLQLNCVAGSTCSVALDTVLLKLLGLQAEKSPIWLLAKKRQFAGSNISSIYLPLLAPEDFSGAGFIAPESLDPVRFNPFRFFSGMAKRVLLAVRR